MSNRLDMNRTSSFEPKIYDSLKEFKSLKELPDTKPLVLVNEKGIIAYSNQSYSKLFALKEGDDLSKIKSEPNLLSLLHSFSKSNYSSFHFDFYLRNGIETNISNYFVDVDRVLIENKEFFMLVFTSHDKRIRIEDRINNLHNALEYGNVPVIITDEEGMINYSSKSFEEILNTDLEQIFNSYLPDVLIDYLSEEDVDVLKEAVNEKKEWVKLISDINQHGELWFKEIKLNPVKKSERESANFILTAHDITHYISKNRIIKKSEQRQKTIINSISDPLLIVRRETTNLIFENANDSFYTDFTMEKEEAVEKKLFYTIPETLYEAIVLAVNKVDNETDPFVKFQYSYNKKEYLGKLTFTDDPYENYRLFIISLADMTEQLESEERLRIAYKKEIQLNKLKSSFLSNISHEIRTPLNVIVGSAYILEDEIKAKNYESMLDHTVYMRDGVNRLVNLIDNIVEVSMLESGEYTLDLMVRNANPIIENVTNNFLEKANINQISLDLDLDQQSLYLAVDEDKFRKILEMLIDNAVKYNRKNGLVLVRSKKENRNVRIEISDSGIGIDPNNLKKILQPFVQEEEEGYKRNYEGAGLGLTIAYKLTKLMSGQFEVQSRVNEGTTISLKFPFVNPS